MHGEGWWAQESSGVRLEWGLTGAERLAPGRKGWLVVVDVLSFTTAVDVATERGTRVLPYPWRDDTAAAFATRHRAALAVGRRQVSPSAPWSLSPAALRDAPFVPRLVLPSPNGSTIAATASSRGSQVVAACLRNAGAVARWLAGQGAGTSGEPVTLVPAGERWPDASLRPALEDLLGAGAVAAALSELGAGPLSPEACAARASYLAVDPAAALTDCSSGRELRVCGFAEDVAIAAEVGASTSVPLLAGGAFTDAAADRNW
ncbi:2-phosphosulfolactate phosphatase [Actinopolymorpha singaporensis]|uniref:Probable 2-phosphosulfolactate phosphatase n=1 Tax=Actinopolymorpha singaporensis TaxID=117157 RepID=A0A1H1WHR6_9ACTN|nr:2-phosphosulfolactate phosphatase [Actinopolymorpha singaporensis]SDS96634.1 2-phosphosulfolactate phosphatase [Actinopolymorpha singaporensis]